MIDTLTATPSTPAPAAAIAGTVAGSEFLAFKMGDEEYGVDILRVQEIRSYEKPTTLANAPEELKGVVNLRGVIVPIIDLRIKMGWSQAQYTDLTVVIVLNLEQRVVGVVVDAVSDVITLEPGQIRAVPALQGALAPEHLLGLGSLNSRMVILLDIEKFLAPAVPMAAGNLAAVH